MEFFKVSSDFKYRILKNLNKLFLGTVISKEPKVNWLHELKDIT